MFYLPGFHSIFPKSLSHLFSPLFCSLKNEAFAAVTLASSKIADVDLEKVNVNGGAVAFGHPIGASGARIILTLAYELKRRGSGIGIAAICSESG